MAAQAYIFYKALGTSKTWSGNFFHTVQIFEGRKKLLLAKGVLLFTGCIQSIVKAKTNV